MKELTLKDIQSIELEILLYFSKFCEKNNLRFYLCGGTLLGAIRHKGFIPWDDDVDVCMPRPDYERLLQIFPKNNPKIEIANVALGNMIAPIIKLKRLDTYIDPKDTEGDIDTNLWLDIFPIDGLPSSEKERKAVYEKAYMIRALFCLNSAKYGLGRTFLRKVVRLCIQPFVRMIGPVYFCNLLEKLAHQHSYEESDYVGCVTFGINSYLGESMKKKEFEKIEYADFCGHKMPIFSCWEHYLRGCYGDFMTLPKKEKRKTHHFKAYLI